MIGCAALLGFAGVLQGFAVNQADGRFMKMAAEANMTEAHLGQMAEAQASHKAVKDFGQTLSMDHTNAYAALTVLANKTGETIPKAIGHDRTIESLKHLRGKAFDRVFTQDEVQSHKAAIAAFRNEAEHGENPDVKAWAKTVIPTLEGHLRTAETLAKQVQSGK
jgi:putative membrane protein